MTEAALKTILIRKERAAEVLDTSVSNFESLVQSGIAPKSRLLGARSVRWLLSEIEEFARNLPLSDLAPPDGSGYGRAGKPKGD